MPISSAVDSRFFSDNLYPFDFEEFSTYRKDRFVESKAFVEKRFGPLDRYALYGAVLYADDLQNPDDQDRDDFLLQRMPQLHASGVPTRLHPALGNLVGSFDADYTRFAALDAGSDVFGDTLFVDPVTGEARPAIVDGSFADVGIDAIPDGQERDSQGRVVRQDGTVLLSSDGGKTFRLKKQAGSKALSAAVRVSDTELLLFGEAGVSRMDL